MEFVCAHCSCRLIKDKYGDWVSPAYGYRCPVNGDHYARETGRYDTNTHLLTAERRFPGLRDSRRIPADPA